MRLRLGVQPAGGVDEHEIGVAARPPRPSRRTRPNQGRRLPGRARSRRRCARPTSSTDLPRRRGTCRPAASTTLLPASLCCAASLPIVVVLPTPLTPTNIHTVSSPSLSAGRVTCRDSSIAAISSRNNATTPSAESTFSSRGAPLHLVEQLLGGVEAHVGEQQRLLEVVPRRLLDPVAGDAAHVARERSAGAAEPVAQARLDDWFGDGRFGDRRFGYGRLGRRRRRRPRRLARPVPASRRSWSRVGGRQRWRSRHAAQVVRDARSARAASP